METTSSLKSFFTEHWKYMAVNTACKINLFDFIASKQMNASKISQEMELNLTALKSLLNALVVIDFLEIREEFYLLTSSSLQLTESHPKSLKYACMNWGEEHMDAWQKLEYSIKTGKSSFAKIAGEDYFDYLNNHPDKLDNYHKAMFEYARDDYAELHLKINFEKHQSILDVGGGYGAAISIIKANFPLANCALFDLKNVIINCQLPNVKVIEGDFFLSLPQEFDALILSRVLHNWNDEKAEIILKNCFKALPINGTLYLIENCSDLISTDLSLLSLNMLIMCESYERSLEQYKKIVTNSGFKFEDTINLNALQTIITFTKL